MTIFTTVQLLERYLDVDEETQDLYYTLGLPCPKTYKYTERSYAINEIEYVDGIEDCPEESLVIFVDGHKIVVLENPDELWIRINDLKCGNIDFDQS
jgi:uncharacterized protein YlzI (FlbEa/FlbD family)